MDLDVRTEAETFQAAGTPIIAQTPEPAPLGRGHRKKLGLPIRFLDVLPTPQTVAPDIPPPPETPTADNQDEPVDPPPATVLPIRSPLRTPPNPHGIFDFPCAESAGDITPEAPTSSQTNKYFPFKNASIYQLMHWMWTGSAQSSLARLQSLVTDVLLAADFKLQDLIGFNAARETKRMDDEARNQHEQSERKANTFAPQDGWKQADVRILLPDRKVHLSEADAPHLNIPGLHYRPLLEVIKSALQSPQALRFHYTPFKKFWRPSPDQPEQRVYDELYTSDAHLEAHEEVQNLPREPGDNFERAVVSLMFWSDSTHLTSFGDASLWPIYLYFGNQSKYERGKPSANACHHVAYIPSDSFQELTGDSATTDVLTHCRRELMHAIWAILLDGDFMHAYKFGLVIKCADGVTRRIFPRFLTYSADYPEKVLLASIRSLSNCPCPRCLTEKGQIHQLGTDTDAHRFTIEQSRKFIFERGYAVKSTAVEKLLEKESLVPIHNTFSDRLSPFGENYFILFVVDLLHEFELGVWKMIFIHLIRLLIAEGGNAVQLLNERYRATPTFGRDIIRKFSSNPSAMKKLAARDYEDLLQCSMPAFEGLLPEPHNAVVMDLLFYLQTWHGLAKLRVHTEDSLTCLEEATRGLGAQIRRFKKVTCDVYDTHELPAETAARGRRKRRIHTASSTVSPKTKQLNLSTFKLHALEHYVQMIRRYGTTDSYSTQSGELEHRRVKKFYGRTNKNNATAQITNLERRERVLRQIEEDLKSKPNKAGLSDSNNATVNFSSQEPLPYTSVSDHHHISKSRNTYVDLPLWIRKPEHAEDPAVKNFLPDLKDHLLGRLMDEEFDGGERRYSTAERNTVHIVHDQLFTHKVLRVNHTTYDLRRGQDSMNPRNHCDVMVLAREDEDEPNKHPYWYARVIGVYHVNVRHTGPRSKSSLPQRMEVLRVRWFGRDLETHAGWSARRLHAIGFVPESDEFAFGFLDPAQVIRGAHIIPGFHHGRTKELLRPSIARQPKEKDEDWERYYVGCFVDRDMLLRYAGGGIGHSSFNFENMLRTTTVSERRVPVLVDGQIVDTLLDEDDELAELPSENVNLTTSASDDSEEDEDSGSDQDDDGDNDGSDGAETFGQEDGEDLYDDNYGFAPL
ncbi:hypothetical protein BD410DRAFT_886035 [Rickenella mellea]|uniref:Uncharacterized protein n=1 Tax=Rickenella mellea TaxID=50990 RepID=A0A4Y7PRM3_9AGAM|nr:hypothetical protein BD410DRAFT_886035 [Rickenella mellea]